MTNKNLGVLRKVLDQSDLLSIVKPLCVCRNHLLTLLTSYVLDLILVDTSKWYSVSNCIFLQHRGEEQNCLEKSVLVLICDTLRPFHQSVFDLYKTRTHFG